MSLKIPRQQYADLYGPTTGDRVRLADTDLFIEIEKDLTTPGEEAKFMAAKSFATAWDNPLPPLRRLAFSTWVITKCAVIVDHGGILLLTSEFAMDEFRASAKRQPRHDDWRDIRNDHRRRNGR